MPELYNSTATLDEFAPFDSDSVFVEDESQEFDSKSYEYNWLVFNTTLL